MPMQTNGYSSAARKNRLIKPALWFLLLAALCVIAWSGYRLWEARQMYVQGDQSYERLQDLVRQPENAADGAEADSNLPQEPQAEAPALFIDFDALWKAGIDAAAWLYCPDTPINYPVMRADDYDWYLHHLPDGTYNANGSLFLDFNGPADFSGNLSIIYGHNMKNGKMFGSLTGYKKQAYFEQHPSMYLYTQEENYRVDLMYGCVIGAGEWRDRAFMFETNLDALLSYAAYNTTFDSGLSRAEGDRVIVFSTCSYEFNDARYVVLGLLRPEYGVAAETSEP
ncbi:class B sortase [Lacrimispora amygdalina]|uniref:Class B sortase n=1 Tax=Lacrimispora amygdalina TaxID=253257 RepID=A0A3E2NF10_9FIRM|nr:class B sortase [Clostridium indicum]RFZ79608.1 class B sortase [Clostridium indicum]